MAPSSAGFASQPPLKELLCFRDRESDELIAREARAAIELWETGREGALQREAPLDGPTADRQPRGDLERGEAGSSRSATRGRKRSWPE